MGASIQVVRPSPGCRRAWIRQPIARLLPTSPPGATLGVGRHLFQHPTRCRVPPDPSAQRTERPRHPCRSGRNLARRVGPVVATLRNIQAPAEAVEAARRWLARRSLPDHLPRQTISHNGPCLPGLRLRPAPSRRRRVGEPRLRAGPLQGGAPRASGRQAFVRRRAHRRPRSSPRRTGKPSTRSCTWRRSPVCCKLMATPASTSPPRGPAQAAR